MQKKCKFLLSFTLWPLIWPLRPLSAFFNFFEILDTYEVQWYAKMFYLSSITSRTISEWNLAFWPTVISESSNTLQMFKDTCLCTMQTNSVGHYRASKIRLQSAHTSICKHLECNLTMINYCEEKIVKKE